MSDEIQVRNPASIHWLHNQLVWRELTDSLVIADAYRTAHEAVAFAHREGCELRRDAIQAGLHSGGPDAPESIIDERPDWTPPALDASEIDDRLILTAERWVEKMEPSIGRGCSIMEGDTGDDPARLTSTMEVARGEDPEQVLRVMAAHSATELVSRFSKSETIIVSLRDLVLPNPPAIWEINYSARPKTVIGARA